MKKNKVGLYLGTNSIGGVLVEKTKVLAFAKFDLTAMDEEAKVENLNEEVKWEALINKVLREVGAEDKEVYISLADKDFIFRSFEMPLMRKKEIESSLTYEVEKYIPFKLEELHWDYSYASFPKDKKIDVSFVGIRDSNFQKTQGILSRLDLAPRIYEPSALSLVRVLKSLKRFSKVQNFALLDFTEAEGYLTFFYYNLPVFNRYFVIPKKDDNIDIDKFVEPIHLSFQYFKREFRAYELDRLIVMANSPNEDLLKILKEEIQAEIDTVVPDDIIGKPGGTLENLKALGVAGIDAFPYKFKPVLKKALGEGEQETVVKEVPWKVKFLTYVGSACAVLILVVFMFTTGRIISMKANLAREEKNIVLPASIKSGQWRDVNQAIQDKERKISSLRKTTFSFKKVSPFLEELPYLLTDGLWLDSLEFKVTEDAYRGSISGAVFLNDRYKNVAAINEFIDNLKGKEEVSSLFANIDMISSETKDRNDLKYTTFAIEMVGESSKGKRTPRAGLK